MSNYLVSSQPEPRRCGHCGAPLVGRFSPCLSCHSLAIEGFGAHAAPLPGLQAAQPGSPQTFPARQPARGFWRQSPGDLVYPYDSIDEAEMVARANRRLRRPIVLAASVLAVSSAVYLGLTHSDALRSGTPDASTGHVSAQDGTPSIAVAVQPGTVGARERPGATAQQQPAALAQHLASVPSSPVATPTASSSEQHRVLTAMPDAKPVIAEHATGATDHTWIDKWKSLLQPSVVAQQPPVVVAQRPASVQSSPVAPPPALSSEQHRVLTASPDTKPVIAEHATGATDHTWIDKWKSLLQPSVVAQQQPAVVAQHPAAVQSSPVTPTVASPTDQQRLLTATPDTRPVIAEHATGTTDHTWIDKWKSLLQPGVVAQQQPAVVAQHPAAVQSLPVTPPVASAPEQHRLLTATADIKPVIAGHTAGTTDQTWIDKLKSLLQPSAVAQQPAAASRKSPQRSSPHP